MKHFLTILLSIYTCLAFAQTEEKRGCSFNDPLLDKMTGEWMMTGDMAGQKVGYSFQAQWVLKHQFMEWEITDILAKDPEYVAKVYVGYDCDTKRYVVHWIDNIGGKFSETLGYGTKKGDVIELKFKYPNGPAVNTISYNKTNNTWQFHLTWQDKTKKWTTWSKTTLTRRR